MTDAATAPIHHARQGGRARTRAHWLLFTLLQLLLWAGVLVVAWLLASWRTPILGAGVALAGLVIVDGAVRTWRPAWQKLAGIALLIAATLPLSIGLLQLFGWYGPRPESSRRMLFHGVEYVREVLNEPYPAVVHLMIVDLQAEGVSVVVTPPDYPRQKLHLAARTTSQFLREFDVQIAVNANHYGPFRAKLPFDIYPLPGDPVEASGAAASAGQHYGETYRYWPTLDISPDGRGRIALNLPRPWHNAVTGIKHFIISGKPIWFGANEGPRVATAAALDASGTKLFLAVVDGEQPPYADGLNRTAFAELLVRHGAADAIALDAGGSATMVIEGRDGAPQLVNRPEQRGVPMIERPIGNHLGIRARRLD